MKNILYLVSLSILIISCDGIFEDLNVDPNNPTSASYENILTGAEVGNIILQSGETARRAGIFGGYYTGIQRQHQGFNNYSLTTSDFDALWDDAFVNTIRNAKTARSVANEAGIQGITAGITRVLEALAFGTEASLFGDIPFEEAADIEIENPAFEPQTEVYAKIQALLDEAIINLQSGQGRPANGSDIYLNGDPTAWTQVAYTLKARFYMHTKEYANALDAAMNGIQSGNNSLLAPHGTAADNSNLNYQFFAIEVRGADVIVSDFMAGLVAPDASVSPDISLYRGNAKTDETGRYDFYFQINDVGTQPNTVNGFAAQDASAPLVTYAENLLILAEAAYRTSGFSAGLDYLNQFRAYMNSGGYLLNATAGDIRYDAYDASDFESGGMENPDGIPAEDALLREILEERYVTLFGQIEGFNDVRRTYTESVVRVPVQPNTGDELPQRFIYPQSEIDRNSNVPDPIPGLFAVTPVNQ